MTIEGILGRKVGMTQIFESDGTAVPVTVIEAEAASSSRSRRTRGTGTRRCNWGLGRESA